MSFHFRTMLAGLALAGVAVPVAAQTYGPPPAPSYPDPYYPAPDYRRDEDIVVEGRYARIPDDAESLSQFVSYRDLDLYYPQDRRELRRRIALAARYLCERLGERDGVGSFGESCRDEATRNALRRVGTVEAHWVPRGSYLVR